MEEQNRGSGGENGAVERIFREKGERLVTVSNMVN